MGLLKQKLLWIGVVAVFVVLMVFGAAMMGSVLDAKPRDLPVALVVLDEKAEMPGGGTLDIGAMVREKLLANMALPLKWEIVGSEAEAREGLQEREYYGALVLPVDMSSGVLGVVSSAGGTRGSAEGSLEGSSARSSEGSSGSMPAAVQLIVNEGMNTQAATVMRTVLLQVMGGVSLELSTQMLGLMSQQMGMEQIPVAAAGLLNPVVVQEETVHAIGVNNASGNAPGLLTQTLWIGSLVTALLLFILNQRTIAEGARRKPVIALQTVVGLFVITVLSGFLVWMASSWYGMGLASTTDTWLFLWLAGSAFFLLQSALFNWIGVPSIAILVLLMFFSMPVLNMAPEFLSQAAQDWLYSWTPLKFGAAGLREVMYFGGFDGGSSNVVVLWWIAGVFLVVVLASGLKRGRRVGSLGSASSAGSLGSLDSASSADTVSTTTVANGSSN